ncbi:MAG: hypothetical protein QF577_09325 [Phycisphaerae bacterium]|jgi:hypothetical protein|nr:hypothetical protein [Phycisphaerae bacterium]
MNEKFEPVGLIEISRQLLGKRRKLDPAKIEEAMKRNETVWKAGYDVGYTEGFKAGSITSTEPTSEQRDRDLLESHGIDIEPLFENVQKIIADHETGSTTSLEQDSDWDKEKRRIWNEAKTNPSYKDHDQDVDEDEPNQYPKNYGGTK